MGQANATALAGTGPRAAFLFESSWKKPYSTRGVRAMLARYAAKAGLAHNMPPHRLRHFLFTWLKTQGIDDALIQPYSGHATRTSLEIYSRLALADAQHTYDSIRTASSTSSPSEDHPGLRLVTRSLPTGPDKEKTR